jgi:hypothetical protein
MLTPYSPTGKFSTAMPLTVVVLANMARELWEDSHRHRDDHEVNRYSTLLCFALLYSPPLRSALI